MLRENKELYEFDKFRIDVSERCLLKNGKRIEVTDRAFDTLCALVRHSNRLISKDELMAEVWADAIVEENSLNKNISALRRILGERDGGKQTFIETVRGHGFRFVAKVRRIEVGSQESGVESRGKSQISDFKFQIENQSPNTTDQRLIRQSGNVIALSRWRREADEDEAEKKKESLPEEARADDEFLKAEENDFAPTEKAETLSPPAAAEDLSPSAAALPVAPTEIRRGWSANRVAALLIVLTLLGGGSVFIVNRFSNFKWTNSQQSFERIKFRKIVGSDGGYTPTISPDGKMAAYSYADGTIWLENLTTGSRVQLKNGDEPIKGNSLKFAPDGNYLYYNWQPEGETQIDIFRVAVPNGTPRKIADNTLTDATVSPDGKQIAFVRQEDGANIEYAIFIANTDGTGERKIASHSAPNWFGLWGSYQAWSPDGTKIATIGGTPDFKVGDLANVIVVNIADGAEFFVPNPDWQTREFGELTWTADGENLLVVAKDSINAPSQIWQVSYPNGVWRRVTNDLNDYARVDVSADGKTLITMQLKTYSHLWQMPFADSTRASQLTSGQTYKDGNAGLALTPDGNKIIYASSESGNYEIWSANIDGTNRRQLTFGGESATEPIVTPDNRYIIFINRTNTIPHLWRMNTDGGNLTQLTRGDKGGIERPAVTPDSRFVIYTAYPAPRGSVLTRIPIDGGEPVELTDKFGGYMPVISPDGKWIAYNFFDYETKENPWRTGIMPVAGGAPVKNIEQPLRGQVRWTTDSQSLLHLDKKWMNIWQMPIFTNGAPKQITDFKAGRIGRFALSTDGKQLILARGDGETTIVLIENEK